MKERRHSIDYLFTVVTFLIYAGCMLTFVYMEAGVYASVNEDLHKHDLSRTVQAYLTEKVRQHDEEGAISLDEIEEIPVLKIEEDMNGIPCVTYIYFRDRKLKELFVPKDREFDPKNGQDIMDLYSLEMEMPEKGRLKFTINHGREEEQSFLLILKSEIN